MEYYTHHSACIICIRIVCTDICFIVSMYIFDPVWIESHPTIKVRIPFNLRTYVRMWFVSFFSFYKKYRSMLRYLRSNVRTLHLEDCDENSVRMYVRDKDTMDIVFWKEHLPPPKTELTLTF